ncbi:MAG: alanine racemase [Nitrospirae bacterium]|nr:alanine racemase [Nitrospirota bacterium]
MTPSRRRKKKSSSSKAGPARRRRPDRSRSTIPSRTAAGRAPTPTGQIQIDLGALRRNASALNSLIGPACELLAVVKADGYGHGMIEVARAGLAGGATRLGVTTVAEGLALREAGLGCPILVMGVMDEAEAPDAVTHRLTPVICRDSQLEALTKAVRTTTRKPAAIHLKADTGMGRLGLPPEECLSLLERARLAPELRVEGIMTHFAEADAAESAYTAEQLDRFRALLNRIAPNRPERVPFIAHAANSAALLTRPESRLQMVRAGLALYGLLPSPSCRGIVELEPVMRWTTRIAHVRRLPAGRSLGYGRTFTTKRPSLIGLLPVGYASGYSRLLSNQAFCLHAGGRAPVVGRISMDLTMIDLTGHPMAQIGDEVVLLGQQERDRVTAEELAAWAQTIPYEITCSAGSRTARRYVESPMTGRRG